MQNNLEERLQQGMYGKPQINPDEKRKFLGTFRERIDLGLTFLQLENDNYLSFLVSEMKEHKEYHLIVNGAVRTSKMNELMKISHDLNFKMVVANNKDYPKEDNDIAVILASDKALKNEEIDISKRCLSSNSKKQTDFSPRKKESFWDKFF